MAKQITTTTTLNSDGITGAWMFVVSPFAQALGIWWYLSNGSLFGAAIVLIAGVTFLGGIILLLIGRQTTGWIED